MEAHELTMSQFPIIELYRRPPTKLRKMVSRSWRFLSLALKTMSHTTVRLAGSISLYGTFLQYR